ncbi:MAG: hypothetical protein ACLFRR_04230, partial [Spirochaetaceae bacterium]
AEAEVPEMQEDEERPADQTGESAQNEWERRAALFDYLVSLAGDLPDEQRQAFQQSDIRLRIETIKARLTGKPGLRADIERHGLAPPQRRQGPPPAVTPRRLRDTFGYIRNLSTYHPDRRVAEALKSRLEVLIKAFQ